MFGVRRGGRSILLAAECAAIRQAARASCSTSTVAGPVPWFCRGIACTFRNRTRGCFRNRARRERLPHVATELLRALRRTCIWDSAAMLRIMYPRRTPVRVYQMLRVESILVDERVVHQHAMIAPARMPAPVAPSMPSGAEVKAHVDAGAEAENKTPGP